MFRAQFVPRTNSLYLRKREDAFRGLISVNKGFLAFFLLPDLLYTNILKHFDMKLQVVVSRVRVIAPN